MTLVLIVLALLTLIVLSEIAALVNETFDNREKRRSEEPPEGRTKGL